MVRGFGFAEFDGEGRYLEAQVGGVSVVSLYLPSGSAGPERQASKFRFLETFLPHLAQLAKRRRDYILAGDWNIAHRPIDLKNWRRNQKNSGFLPEERAWMDGLFGPAGFVDAFREVRPGPELYTWWSNRGQARANNVGWRIDYQVVSPRLAGKARAASIYKEKRFSDHAPLIMDYDFEHREAPPGRPRSPRCSRARRCSRSWCSPRLPDFPTSSPRARCRRGSRTRARPTLPSG